MAKGISITVTRRVERRHRRKDEIAVNIWTGTKWVSPSATPRSPALAWIYGTEPKVISTKIEFLPPGVVSHSTLEYQKVLLPRMRALGVIK